MNPRRSLLVLLTVLALFGAACGDDDSGSDDAGQTDGAATDGTADDSGTTDDGEGSADDSSADDSAADDSSADDSGTADDGGTDDGAADGDDAASTPSGGGGGTLVLGDETIAFDRTQCFLQEQDAFAGGGKILFVAQGFGTNAEGVELMIDVSRYDEDSQFTGDDVAVDIGDPFSDDAVRYGTTAELGTVQLDGSTLRADGLTLTTYDDAGVQSDLPASFELNC